MARAGRCARREKARPKGGSFVRAMKYFKPQESWAKRLTDLAQHRASALKSEGKVKNLPMCPCPVGSEESSPMPRDV